MGIVTIRDCVADLCVVAGFRSPVSLNSGFFGGVTGNR